MWDYVDVGVCMFGVRRVDGFYFEYKTFAMPQSKRYLTKDLTISSLVLGLDTFITCSTLQSLHPCSHLASFSDLCPTFCHTPGNKKCISSDRKLGRGLGTRLPPSPSFWPIVETKIVCIMLNFVYCKHYLYMTAQTCTNTYTGWCDD